MVASKAPKRLWDDFIELEAFIQSNTSFKRYKTFGEVSETNISGETSDISQFCEHPWYGWVKFWDTLVSFPDDKVVLGRYLGPSIDVGPAMTAKLLKANGQVVHRSTYRALTDQEMASDEEKQARKDFDEKVAQKLGPSIKWPDLPAEDAETPSHEVYQDNSSK